MKTENKNTLPELTPELLERARAGERDALTALYEATELEIYRTVHALLRDEDLSRDVQQDVYLHAFSRLDQLRDPAAFLPWLRQIAVNEARAQLRRKRPLLFSELTDEEETELPDLPDVRPEASPELTLERKENARLVREILDELPDGQRILLGMYYYEQMPVKQIAADTGLSEGTVKTQLHRGRKRVEEAVKRLEEQGVKLFGLAPLPFLLALLKHMTPAAEQNKIVMARALNKAGVVPITEAATVHVGRSFFETALGKVVLCLIAAAAVAGGAVGWRWYQSHVSYGDVRPPETLEINLRYDTDEDLTTEPTAETDTEPVTTAAPETNEDLVPETGEDLPSKPTEPVDTADPVETTPSVGAGDHTGPDPTESTDPTDSDADGHSSPIFVRCGLEFPDKGSTESEEIYDFPWGATYFYAVVEGYEIPELSTNNPSMIVLGERGKYFLGDHADNASQDVYMWRVTISGGGIGRLFVDHCGERVRTITINNPEYPDKLLRWEVFGTETETGEIDCRERLRFSLTLVIQGWSKPVLSTDDPEALSIEYDTELFSSDLASQQRMYRWSINVQKREGGTADLRLTLNGKPEHEWAILLPQAEEEMPSEQDAYYDKNGG